MQVSTFSKYYSRHPTKQKIPWAASQLLLAGGVSKVSITITTASRKPEYNNPYAGYDP